jgi:hypothetical protein
MVLLCHESLDFRTLHTIRFPRGEGVCQQFFFKWTVLCRVPDLPESQRVEAEGECHPTA